MSARYSAAVPKICSYIHSWVARRSMPSLAVLLWVIVCSGLLRAADWSASLQDRLQNFLRLSVAVNWALQWRQSFCTAGALARGMTHLLDVDGGWRCWGEPSAALRQVHLGSAYVVRGWQW